jgi:hypothetical protein
MIGSYYEFFSASASASAAFIGLLFVAVSFIDNEKVDEVTQNWRRILANSSFSQLVNIFFVSLASLIPESHSFAMVGLVMSVLGLLVSLKLLPKTVQQEKTGRSSPTRLGLIAVAAYLLQLVTSIGLIQHPDNKTLLNYFVLAIIILYAGALARAWEITGIRKH